MEKIEKVLLLAVLIAALLIIAVMSLFPEEKTPLDGPGKGDIYAKEKLPSTNLQGRSPEGGKLTRVENSSGSTLTPSKGKPSPMDDGGLHKMLTLEGEENPSEKGSFGEGSSLGAKKSMQTKGLEKEGGLGQEALSRVPGLVGGSASHKEEKSDAALSAAAPSFHEGSLEEGGQFLRYRIQKGDAFSTILEKVCGTARPQVKELVLAANEQLDPNRILAGHVLLIPKEAIALGKRLLAKAKAGQLPAVFSPAASSVSRTATPRLAAKSAVAKPLVREPDAAVSGFAGIITLKREGAYRGNPNAEGSLYRSPQTRGRSSRAKVIKAEGLRTYRVKKGDSFWKIAAKFLPKVPGESKAKRSARIHLFVQKLQDLNPEFAGGALDVGNKIRVPR